MARFKRLIFLGIIIILIAFISVFVVLRIKRFNDSLPAPEQIDIEVLNGCGVPKLASKMRILLAEKGFNVVNIDDTEKIFDKTIIIEHSNPKMKNAIVLSRIIKCKNLLLNIDSLVFADITLIIGKDYKKYIPDTVKVYQ